MADQTTHDVVNEVLSVDGPSSIDVPASTTKTTGAGHGQAADEPSISHPPLHDATASNSTAPAVLDAPPVIGGDEPDQQADDSEAATGLEAGQAAPEELSMDASQGPLPDGNAGQSFGAEEVLTLQALPDGSAGSDTDTSKPEIILPKDGSPQHTRSNSAKKITSFKRTSVTKNFLAKNAATVSTPKLADKASPGQSAAAAQLTSKPRLVAKSGSGVGNAISSGLAKLNGTSGMGASKVWNKNQPTAPPPPKQYTDEELKQQYGIHLADRLRIDETSKESTWADLDEDEDDWAPETVEWMDGTKSTVIPTENQGAPVPEQNPPPAAAATPAEVAKPTTPAPPPPTGKPSTKTILKPGSHAAGQSGKIGSSAQKGAMDKPTLVAKPSAAAPVKSPWASLPPVDKASPIVINPLPSPLRMPSGDARSFDRPPPALSPAKEIAADDFNRSWREDRANKELFNSQSGRYEPVNDARRGSTRQDQPVRQPSVLQRPPSNQPFPEPSPAFQTSRSTAAGDGSWGRRRASSNVSAGSLGQPRRPSIHRQDPAMVGEAPSQGPEIKASHDAHMLTSAGHARPSFSHERPQQDHVVSPSTTSQVSLAPHSSPSVGSAQPVSPRTAAPSASSSVGGPAAHHPAFEQDILKQQRLMKQEGLERAKQEKMRRLEAEQKEEEAKKERLRLKMQALEKLDAPEAGKGVLGANHPRAHPPAASPHSPPKPPKPTAAGEVAQYGLMKVHQPQPVTNHSPEGAVAASANKDQPSPPKPLETSAVPAPNHITPSPRLPSTAPIQGRTTPRPESGPQKPTFLPPSNQWQATGRPERYSGWGGSPNPSQTPTGNVWGPPNADRALGNGTFDGSYHRVPPVNGQPSAPNRGSLPPPVVLSATHAIASSSAQPFDVADAILEQQHPPASGVSPPQVPRPSSRAVDQRAMAPGASTGGHAAVAPLQESVPTPDVPSRSAWSNFAEHIDKHDKNSVAASEQFQAAPSSLQAEWKPVFRETWIRTAKGQSVASKNAVETTSTVHTKDSRAAARPHANVGTAPAQNIGRRQGIADDQQTTVNGIPSNYLPPHLRPRETDSAPRRNDGVPSDRSAGDVAGAQTQPPLGPNGGRSSRFFPKGHEGALPTPPTRSSSPPPSDPLLHPVYDGDSHRPKVNLPIPKVIVKLPPVPSPPPSPPPAVVMPVRSEPPRFGYQPIVSSNEWQDRINVLFGKPPQVARTPSGGPVVAVSSASKAPLDVPAQRTSATVSLPSKDGASASPPASSLTLARDDGDSILSRRTEDLDEYFQMREFGSTPTVCLPQAAHRTARLHPVQPPRHLSKKIQDACTGQLNPPGMDDWETNGSHFFVSIRLPGVDSTTSIAMSRPRPRKQSHHNKRRSAGPRESSGGSHIVKNRKPVGNQHAHGPPQRGSSRPSSSGTEWRPSRPSWPAAQRPNAVPLSSSGKGA